VRPERDPKETHSRPKRDLFATGDGWGVHWSWGVRSFDEFRGKGGNRVQLLYDEKRKLWTGELEVPSNRAMTMPATRTRMNFLKNGWYHFVFTVDSKGERRVYSNRVQVASESSSGASVIHVMTRLKRSITVGSSGWAEFHMFSLWDNICLTPLEVSLLYRNLTRSHS
jgi:hypothetical protein